MRAHHEKIAIRLFQSVVNNPSNKIHGLLPKKCSRPLILFKETGESVVDLHKTKTKGFADTYINKSSSVDIHSWLAVYMYILRLVTYMYHILAYYIFRFVKLCNSVYYAKRLNETQSIFLYLSLSIWMKYNLRFIFFIICLFHPCVWEWNLEM